jgi:hypothetical protein
VAGHRLTMRVVLERAAAADDGTMVRVAAGAIRVLRDMTRSMHRQDVDFVPLSKSAVNKSSASIPCAWDRRNAGHPPVPSRRGPGRSRRP